MDQFLFYLPGILLAYSVFLVGVSSPGPNILAIIGTSMSVSRRAGVALALGVAFGSLTWGTLTAFGLAALFSAYASALLVIKVVGGLYLIFLGYKAFRSAMALHDLDAHEGGGEPLPAIRYALRGFTVQMTNPKAALFWVAMISLGFQPETPAWVPVTIVIGIFLLSIITHTLYAMAFSTPIMVAAYSRARRLIQGTLGVFFSLAGLKLLTERA
ncbi:MAG: LysE family translocator [Pseudomonadota bacterium]